MGHVVPLQYSSQSAVRWLAHSINQHESVTSYYKRTFERQQKCNSMKLSSLETDGWAGT